MLVCHDRRAPLNRALGTRSPIMDIEHLQLFSQRSARALLERTGFGDVQRALDHESLPAALLAQARAAPRRRQAGARRRLRAAAAPPLSLPLPVGNLAVTGFRALSVRS